MFDAVIAIRQQKLPNPALLANTGSFFKNPRVDQAMLTRLGQQFPALPYYPVPHTDQVKLSAAWMIEHCGWRGKRHGAVGVYKDHALVIVNHGGGTLAEIRQLSEQIQQQVWQTFGVALEPEVLPLCRRSA